MSKQIEALKLALDCVSTLANARDWVGCNQNERWDEDEMYAELCNATICLKKSLSIIQEALAEQPAQEPVSDALHFAQWTAAKKDLSDYILVGSLSLAGIEDGEYGTSEIDPLDNTIEALQEKLVTGPDHKKVPLLAYIGALNNTSPQPAQRCPLCNYQHGHAIGCENNPVDIALAKMAEQPAQQHIEHCLWARNGNQPCPHVQPAQEPFGYFRAEPFGWTNCAETDDGAIALYTSPQPSKPWVGLTTADLDEIDAPIRERGSATISEIYRAIEAKLREKNA